MQVFGTQSIISPLVSSFKQICVKCKLQDFLHYMRENIIVMFVKLWKKHYFSIVNYFSF